MDRPYRHRKRDGVLGGHYPDDGWFYYIVSYKSVCLNCKKSWRKWESSVDKCPECGHETIGVPPMSRIPRKRNVKGWRRIAKKLNSN